MVASNLAQQLYVTWYKPCDRCKDPMWQTIWSDPIRWAHIQWTEINANAGGSSFITQIIFTCNNWYGNAANKTERTEKITLSKEIMIGQGKHTEKWKRKHTNVTPRPVFHLHTGNHYLHHPCRQASNPEDVRGRNKRPQRTRICVNGPRPPAQVHPTPGIQMPASDHLMLACLKWTPLPIYLKLSCLQLMLRSFRGMEGRRCGTLSLTQAWSQRNQVAMLQMRAWKSTICCRKEQMWGYKVQWPIW